MLELTNFREEAITLAKWLIAIPSITGTNGEAVIIKAVYEGLSEFRYFREHRDNLRLVSHADGKNHSIIALVQPNPEIRDTLVVLCDTDTSGNESYGVLKNFAFKCDELKERLPTTTRDHRLIEHLRDEEQLFGLGAYETKAAAGALIVLLKDLSDDLGNLPINLMFICASNSIKGHQGMRECLTEIHDIQRTYDLHLKLTVDFKPQISSWTGKELPLYTANMGQVETCFYILGQGAGSVAPFSGFSPTLIAAKIIHKTELNPHLTKTISNRAMVPTFRYLNCHNNRNPNSPDAVQLGFTMPFVNISLSDLLEELKQVAASAIEEAALATDDRQSSYCAMQSKVYEPFNRDAEVISYSDLFYRASRHYRGDLTSAIEGLLQKCVKEGLTAQSTARTVIERLNDLAHLPRPSVVLYLGNDFVPQQRLSRSNAADRELYIKIDKAVQAYNEGAETKIGKADEYPPTDGCFLRPIGIDLALNTLETECPVPVNNFYNLEAPTVTLCLKGEGLYSSFEHMPVSMFDVIPKFVLSLLDSFAPPKEGAAEEGVAVDDGGEENEAPASLVEEMPEGFEKKVSLTRDAEEPELPDADIKEEPAAEMPKEGEKNQN